VTDIVRRVEQREVEPNGRLRERWCVGAKDGDHTSQEDENKTHQ
jgi:hypothetical protein